MKVIIVEDERVVRDGLEKLLLGFDDVEVICKCASANEGYRKIMKYRPNVVITDIVMSKEDGLDMIEWCRKAGIRCEFVLISGYSEFEYAQRALRLNVFDYLNKPLDHIKMQDIVARLHNRLLRNKERTNSLVDYFSGIPQPKREDEAKHTNQNKLFAIATNIFHANDCENDLQLSRQFFEQASHELKNYYRVVEKNGMLYMIVTGLEDREIFISTLLIRVKKHSARTEIGIRIGVSHSFNDISEIGNGITEAMATVQDCALSGKSVGDMELLPYNTSLNTETLFIKEYRLLRDKLLILDAHEICEATLRKLNILYDTVPPFVLFKFLNKCVRELCWNIDMDSEFGAIEDRINSSPSFESLIARYGEIIKQRVEQMRKGMNLSKNGSFERVLSYVDIHYSDMICAYDIAKKFYIDPAYFSKLFKRETGYNYKDYITRLRMNKAMVYLQTGRYSVVEVANMVGFRSARHFSKVFRIRTGYYPSDISCGQKNAP